MATKKSASTSAPAKSAAKKAAPAKTIAKSAGDSAVNVKANAGGAEKRSPANHTEIAKRAHQYFQERGGHHGSHVADWLRAENDLNG